MALEGEGIGIFVCDNASSDDSMSRLRDWGAHGLPGINLQRVASGRPAYAFVDLSVLSPSERNVSGGRNESASSITLIQNGRNGGFAAGNNVGVRHALAQGFEYFWLLNNDTVVEPDALKWLLARMSADPTIGICGSTLIYFALRDRIQAWAGAKFLVLKGRGVPLGEGHLRTDPIDRDAVERQMRYVIGASMFVRRAFIEEVGLMQEDYFLYSEEIDWATRGRAKFRLGYAPESVVYHKVGASIGTNDFGESSALSDYYLTRSRVKFCWRHSRVSMPFVVFDISRSILRRVGKRQWARAGLLIRALIQRPLPNT